MKVLFTGDVSFTGKFSEVSKFESLFSENVNSFFNEHQFICVNLEGPATNTEVIFDKAMGVKNPVESVKFLKEKGVTYFNLANNHTFDCGLDGFNEVKDVVEGLNAQYFGSGKNIDEASKIVYMLGEGIKVALLAVGDSGSSSMVASKFKPGVFSDNHISHIKSKVKEARGSGADFVVLCFHNGTEFNFYPVKYIRDKLRRISDEGVDLIVGHHPHVVQPIEYRGNRVIAYSLGNFIFDLPGHCSFKGTSNSLLLSVIFKKGLPPKVNYKITEINKLNACVDIVENSKIEKIVLDRLDGGRVKYFLDNSRVIFTGLPNTFSKRLLAYILYPIYLLYRLKSSCHGNSRALVEDNLDYIKLGFIKKAIKTKRYLDGSNEF
jgi:hypothetical protein